MIALDVLEEYGEQEKLGQPVAIESAQPKQEQEDVKPQPGNIAGNGFYGNKPQAQQQQAQRSLPSRPNGASHGSSHGMITPIEAISPYTHKWTIKARCTHKGDVKTWHNKNGEGKLFSANFLDDSGEIRATMFNDAVDQWYDVLQEGEVYYVSSPCRVQLAKKQFSNLNNDYELTFEKDTQVEKAEDNEGVPQVSYNFTTIEALQNVDKDTTTDILGVLQDVGEVSEITSKNSGKPFSKRDLTLVDDTGYNIRLTVWGKTAETFDVPVESVIAFKGVRVSDFGGRSLSLSSSGTMNPNPDIDEAFKLKGWYDGAGRNTNFATHANTMSLVGAAGGKAQDTKSIAQIRDEGIGMGQETDYFSVKATIVYIKQDSFAYPACRTTDPQPCNKKVTEEGPGEWRCEKCSRVWDAPKYRYIMSVNVSDHTGQIWLSCFDEVGERVMGMPANDLMRMKEEGDDKRVTEAFGDANCQTFVFKCRAKMDTFNDQQRYVSLPHRDWIVKLICSAECAIKCNMQTRSTTLARRRSWRTSSRCTTCRMTTACLFSIVARTDRLPFCVQGVRRRLCDTTTATQNWQCSTRPLLSRTETAKQAACNVLIQSVAILSRLRPLHQQLSSLLRLLYYLSAELQARCQMREPLNLRHHFRDHRIDLRLRKR